MDVKTTSNLKLKMGREALEIGILMLIVQQRGGNEASTAGLQQKPCRIPVWLLSRLEMPLAPCNRETD